MEPAKDQLTLAELAVGARLLVRSKMDWRFAAVSRVVEDRMVLTVASPTGRNYRIRREIGSRIAFDGKIPVLTSGEADSWRDNFGKYDSRW